jgi:hypothetical protein
MLECWCFLRSNWGCSNLIGIDCLCYMFGTNNNTWNFTMLLEHEHHIKLVTVLIRLPFWINAFNATFSSPFKNAVNAN